MQGVQAIAGPLMFQLTAQKVLLGLIGLTVNLGGRFIMADYLTPLQQRAFRSPLVKRAVIFCMAFLACRDLVVAAGLTLAVVVLFEGLLSENSRFCLVPGAASFATPAALSLPAMPRVLNRPRHARRGEPAPPSLRLTATFARHESRS